ncbi:hypothetical protein KNO81_12240 [Paraburkholderia sediminicola]|nr:hypothetical protein [Paraburkholderia sediminicola]
MASTHALAAPASYLNALRGDLAALTRHEPTKGSGTSTLLVPTDAIADVGEVVRQLSERSDALLSVDAVGKGTLTAANPTVVEVPAKQDRSRAKGVSPAASRAPRVATHVTAYTAPIEVFEGTVRSVNRAAEVMYVTLTSKTRDVSDHAADISFAWVNPQDLDLVAPGAVFYLSLYKERRGGTIRNTEELRFRRMPTWTRTQIAQVREDADRLYSRLQARPLLEE